MNTTPKNWKMTSEGTWEPNPRATAHDNFNPQSTHLLHRQDSADAYDPSNDMFASVSSSDHSSGSGGLDAFSRLTVSTTPRTTLRVTALETRKKELETIVAALYKKSVQDEEDLAEVEVINQKLQTETIELKQQLAIARKEKTELLLDREELEFALADAEQELAARRA